jgi:hypothetical protein
MEVNKGRQIKIKEIKDQINKIKINYKIRNNRLGLNY